MKFFLVFTFFSFVLSGCGGGGSSNTFSKITESTMSSAPMIKSSASIKASSLNQIKTSDFNLETTITKYHSDRIKDFFKLQCHMASKSSSFCPEKLDVVYNNSDPYKLTISTLIGLVYHAIMYGENIYAHDASYKTCSKGDDATKLTNNTPYYEGSASHDLIVNIPSFFDCTSKFTYNKTDVYSTYYTAEDDDAYGIVTSRYMAHQAEFNSDSSDIFQVYASQIVDGVPNLIAANLSTFNTMANRAVIISDLKENKFIVKYQTPTDQVGKYKMISAMGVAGIKKDGTWVEGSYIVKSQLQDEITFYCIKNGETPTIVEDSQCSSIMAFMTKTDDSWTNVDVKDFFKLDETDNARLVNFIEILNNGDLLEASRVPTGHDSFPKNITAK